MNTAAPFGPWLKERRQALDLTQEALAERIDCSVDTIRKIEAGTRRPSRQIAELLGRTLGIAPEWQLSFLQWARGAAPAEVPPARPGAPPAATPPPAAPAGTSLPVLLTPLIGRAHELAQARSLLWRVGVRLVTLTGPGGTGKTRLALELARELQGDFAGGVYFVPLAPIQAPDLVAATIAAALGLTEEPGRSAAVTLQAALRDKACLLVLDNFEQVIAAAPLVSELLQGAPRLKILVTSRARLQVRGEKEFPVPPLAVPEPGAPDAPEALAAYPAVTLFVERAQDAQPDFALTTENAGLVAAVCRRLDGLPLAIELAAARTRMLSLRDLLAQLSDPTPGPALSLLAGGYRDLPARQQALRDTIAWSYNLLSPAAQDLFARLAVFVGGCTPEAAAALGEPGSPAPRQALDLIGELLDNSLVQREETGDGEFRVRLLGTIRAFAVERLATSDRLAALQRRHAAYFLARAEAHQAELRGPDQGAWFARWEADHDNLRAALDWADAQDDRAFMLRLGIALWRFWYGHGHLSEGRRRFEAGLAPGSPGAARVPPAVRAKALSVLGTFAEAQADLEPAGRYLAEALNLYRALGDEMGLANTLNNFGNLLHHRGDDARAGEMYTESLTLFRALGDAEAIADALGNLGALATAQGNYAAALPLQEESLQLRRGLGDRWGIAASLQNLGDLAERAGDLPGAMRLQEESLGIFRALGDQMGTAVALNNLANLALLAGDLARCAALAAESLAFFREIGDKRGCIWAVDMVAGLAAARGEAAVAVRLVAAAQALRGELGAQPQAHEQAAYEATLATARTALEPAAYTAAWEAGPALTLEQAMAEAAQVAAAPPAVPAAPSLTER